MQENYAMLNDYTSEHDAAQQLKQTVRTLRAWRHRGEGPTWIKIGKRVYYPNTGIPAWLKSLERKPVRSRRA
jgi:hypothetical protein